MYNRLYGVDITPVRGVAGADKEQYLHINTILLMYLLLVSDEVFSPGKYHQDVALCSGNNNGWGRYAHFQVYQLRHKQMLARVRKHNALDRWLPRVS